MKYALLVGDGMADEPQERLNGKTPLAYAHTPHMDALARAGRVGRVVTIPPGMPAGSDVANMALMGYDPQQYYSGRAPIEAASMGVALDSEDTAFRCNLVTLESGRMADYSAGHIDTAQARELIDCMQQKVVVPRGRFYPGISYRHLFVLGGGDFSQLDTTPPHDITGQPWHDSLPSLPAGKQLVAIMDQARAVLKEAQVNAIRRAQGKLPATDIWLWGQGKAVTFPPLYERFGIEGSVISAVDLVKGLGVLAGLSVAHVEGATGYLGTNYAGKVAAAMAALETQDFVYVHVEAPDETSHEGNLDKKIQAIEEFDKNIVGPFVERLTGDSQLRVLVAPDHATPVRTRTHDPMPVPFCVAGVGVASGKVDQYSESAAQGFRPYSAVNLFVELMRGTFQR